MLRKRFSNAFVVLALIALILQSPAFSQSKSSKPSLYEFIFVKVKPGMRQEFMEFMKKEYLPLHERNNYIKGRKMFLEDPGTEYDFIVVMEYDDYMAFQKNKARHEELLSEKYPEKKERDAFIKKFQSYVDKHQHAFYRSIPELSK